MHTIIRPLTILLTAMLWTGGLQAGDLAATTETHDFYTPEENLVTGGQPSRDELAALKAAGVNTVINLRGPGEKVSFDPSVI